MSNYLHLKMRKYTLLLFISFFVESSFCQSEVPYPEGFNLLNDFTLNKSLFKQDIVDWGSKEDDYGYVWKSDQRDYVVYELFQFRNEAEIHTLYVADNNLKCKIARRIANNYDKGWIDTTKTMVKTEEYYLFVDGGFKRLGGDLREINSPSNDTVRKEIESLFKAATQK